jgi:hypothetical protein
LPSRIDQVHPPQRAGVVEALGHQLGGDLVQSLHVDHPLRLVAANVLADVERRVVHPGRPGEAQRHHFDALAAAPDPPQPRLDVAPQILDLERASAGRGLEDDDLARVAGDRGRFEPEDLGVIEAEAIEGPGHGSNVAVPP